MNLCVSHPLVVFGRIASSFVTFSVSTYTLNMFSKARKDYSASDRAEYFYVYLQGQRILFSSVDAMQKYPHLFSPLSIAGGRINLSNRYMMAPLYLNLESEIDPKGKQTREGFQNAMANFYATRAAENVDLVVVGGISPSFVGRWKRHALRLTNYDSASILSAVSEAVHKENSRCLLQCFHAGRSAFNRFYVAPSIRSKSNVHPYQEFSPVPIPGMLINYVVSEYERFAVLAEASGFDGIEIPLSEGSLLHNFLSQSTNFRSDSFGGSAQRRYEIVHRVLSTVKSSLKRPDDFSISVRLCVHDLKHDGNTMDDTLEIAEAVARCGVVDLLTTSVGMHDSPVLTMGSFVPPATFAPAVKQIRDHLHNVCGITHIPIAASHGVSDPTVAEELIKNGTCDLVMAGRALLADPKLVTNAKEGAEDKTMPCIGCLHCVDRLYKHQRVTCAVNPMANYELDTTVKEKVAFQKKIAIVGAGPAGIACALTARARGHEVILFEKEPYIGGQLNLAKLIPGKEKYFALLEYWVKRLRESDIHIRFGTHFGDEDVTRLSNRFDAIVMTVGSQFRQPNSAVVPGTTECPILATIPDILTGRVVAGRRVAILGNGSHAYDLASFLVHDHKVARTPAGFRNQFGINLDKGTLEHPEDVFWDTQRNNREVVVFEKPEHGPDFARGKGWFIKHWARQHKIDTIRCGHFNFVDKRGVTFTTLLGIQEGGGSGQQFLHACDTIVYAFGMLPNYKEAAFIREWIKDGATQRGMVMNDFGIYFAGSCRDAATSLGQGEQDLLRAIHEGHDVGLKI